MKVPVFPLKQSIALAAALLLVDQRSERLLAWIALYRALGGGWSPTDAIALLTSPSDAPTDPRNP